MASGVHAVALRLKQAKKKKLLLDQQQQQLGLKPPPDKNSGGRINEPNRSPNRAPPGWDAGSDFSGLDGRTGSNAEHRYMADRAYKKWLKKNKDALKYETIDFRQSYIAAGESRQFDTLLWSGLAILLTGTIISFVGLGEKGFRTSYLRLLGPILSGTGLAVVIIRIGVCCCAKHKRVSTINVKDQLAKMVQAQHAVAVRSIYNKADAGSTKIPAIQIDRSGNFCMKTSVTAATNLSPETTPVLSSENEPLIRFQSTENSPILQTTTAVIESEWTSRTQRERLADETDYWRSSCSAESELTLSPMSLAKQENMSLLPSCIEED